MKVKRPAILFLSATILGIIIAYSRVPILFKLLLIAIAIFLYAKLYFDGKLTKRFVIIAFLFLLIGFYRFKYEEKIFDRYDSIIENLKYGNKTLSGKIEVIGRSTNSNYYILSNCIVDGEKLGSCRCYFNDEINPYYKIGNIVKVNAGLQIIDSPMNEGEFNQRNYYRSDGIGFISYAKDFTLVDGKVNVLKQNIYDIKVKIKDQISKVFDGKDAGLFSAMITGDKTTIDKKLKKLFSDNGIAHILAISGLHLSILGLALFEILRKKLSVQISAGIVSIFILFYGIFIDASASSLRAISMLYIRFLSLCIGRSYDSKNTLYIICFIFLMIHPYLLFNAGFQFSYIAIFALNHKVIIKRDKKFASANYNDNDNYVKDTSYEALKESEKTKKSRSIRVPAVIILTIFLFPVTIYHYFTYPLYSILLNLVIIPLMSFVLGFGILGLLVSFIILPFGKVIVYVVHLIFLIYEKLCNAISYLPMHIVWIGKPTLYEVLFFYVSIFLIIWAISNNDDRYDIKKFFGISDEKVKVLSKNNIIIRTAICVLLLVMSILILSIRPRSDLRMTFLSIGQGDGILVEARDMAFIIDGGSTSNKNNGQYLLTPHIKSRAISNIDYVFISHSDADHINGIKYLLDNEEELKIKNIVLPEIAKSDDKFNELLLSAGDNNINVIYAKEKDEFRLKDNLLIEVLNPLADAKITKIFDVNELAMVLRLTYNNHSALFTGDIGKETIHRMLHDEYDKDKLKVDVLKVPHHGSKNSMVKEFYEVSSPKYSVLSYGKGNSYGHPHKVTVENLQKVGSELLKTAVMGQIDIYFDEKQIKINTYK